MIEQSDIVSCGHFDGCIGIVGNAGIFRKRQIDDTVILLLKTAYHRPHFATLRCIRDHKLILRIGLLHHGKDQILQEHFRCLIGRHYHGDL